MKIVLALLLMLCLPQHSLGQKQDSATLAQNQTEQPSTPITLPQKATNSRPNQQCPYPESPPWWKTPEGWLAIIGIPTLGVLIWQAFKTHEAADAAKLSAEATARQVSHLIASERPWLLIKASGDGRNQVMFAAHNAGKSPAQIIWRDPFIPGFAVPIGESLPSKPNYPLGFTEGGELVHSIWVAPGESAQIGIFDSFSAFPPDSRIFVFSAIKYKNTFDDRIHESRFCYRISHGVYEMGGPFGYNQHT